MKHFLAAIFVLASFSLAANEPPPDTIKSLSDKEQFAAPLIEELRQALVDLRLAEKEFNPAKMLAPCLRLGKLYRRLELHSRAQIWFEQAVTLARNAGTEDDWLAVQTLLAETLLDNGQPQQAHDVMLIVLEKHEKANRYQPSVQALQKLADACAAMRQFPKASNYYLKIKALALAQGDLPTAMTALNNLGFAASQAKDHAAAARYFSSADSLSASTGTCTPGYVYTNLGIAQHNLGDSEKAVKTLLLANAEEVEKSYVQHLIATIHLKNQDVYGALRYNELALKSAAKSKNAQVLCDAYDVASQVYQQLFEYDKALDFYKKHLWLKDSLLREERLNQQNLENLHALLEEKEHEISQNLKDQEIQDLAMSQLQLSNLTKELENDKLIIEADRQAKQIALLAEEKKARDANLRATELEAARAAAALRLATQELLAAKRKSEIDKLNRHHLVDSLENDRQAAEQQGRIVLLEKDKRLNELELAQQEQFQQNAYRLGALLAAILLVIFASWLYARRLNKRLASQNHQIASQKEEIDAERGRAENLLLNILPVEVAQELKTTGAAKPQHYDSVTVLFTDFEGFTKIASTMPPAQVVQELNECF
ncbi:MAG: adenylate/guanylate cyclase domain-containing protein, partial [Bacteroidota bacterium]